MGLEISDIFNKSYASFRSDHKVTGDQAKASWNILNCRTEKLGAHIDYCTKCEHKEVSYNSCRNRHCPKCQGSASLRWLGNRVNELLPIPWFHIVFTLPSEINNLAIMNPKPIYDLFFKTVNHTTKVFAKDPKHLGANIGCISVLHTWGQKLDYHPHIHLIVSSGGIAFDKSEWINPQYAGRFLFPVKALSKVFRGKFMEGLQILKDTNKLEFHGPLKMIEDPTPWYMFKSELYKHNWVIYAKKPFKSAEKVLAYLGRYTHKIAISNYRLVEFDDSIVSFNYKDYSDNNKKKVCSLKVNEFIRRFLKHVVPCGFKRIRYFGFLGTNNRNDLIKIAEELLSKIIEKFERKVSEFKELAAAYFHQAEIICPHCEIGILEFRYRISAHVFNTS